MEKTINNKHSKLKIIVIGGGPSGIMAAIAAAKNGASVTIIEKKTDLGKKILISGNGRCNLSNDDVSWENYHGKFPKFAASVLGQFSNWDTLDFFHKLGLETKTEDRGRIFPVSDQADSVLDVLSYELESLDVRILFQSKVESIEKVGEKFEVDIFNGKKLIADKLIIATGGKTYSKLGSSGDGYSFARKFGHTIEDLYPVSTGFDVASKYKPLVNKLQGVKVEAGVSAFDGVEKLAEDMGTVLFTHFGLSAWAIMRLSFEVSRVINIGNKEMVDVFVDFFPEYDKNTLDLILQKRWEDNPKKSLGFSFVGLMQKKIAPALLDFAGFDITKKSCEVSKSDRLKIVDLLKNYKFEVVGVRSWDEAQFTMGGVSVKEIDPKTMESKLVPNLYFCGEVVDITGDSGGYNLQWAWSSGFVAGSASGGK